MPETRAAAKTRSGVQRRVTTKEIRIGISGWRYAGWRGKFYPKDLPQHRELEFAGKTFNSIEINGSFYSLQRPASYRAWHEATPSGFMFSVKGSRFITHLKRLKDVETLRSEVTLAKGAGTPIAAREKAISTILGEQKVAA